MPWGRFLLVALVTSVLLLPVSAAAAPFVARIDEPWRSALIIVVVVLAYFAVDRLFSVVRLLMDQRRRG